MNYTINLISKIVLVIFSYLFIAPIWAQNNEITKLITLASKTNNDSTKLNYFLKICELCDVKDNLKYGMVASSIADKLISKSKSESEKENFIKKKIFSNEIICVYYEELKQLDSLEKYKIARIEFAKTTKNQDLIHDQINALAEFYRINNFHTKAIQLFREKLKEAELANNTEDIIFSLRGISHTYARARDNKKALEYALQTLRLVKKSAKNSTEIYWQYLNVANNYFGNNKYDSAFFYLDRAYHYLKSTINARQKIRFIFDIARTLNGLNKSLEARNYFHEGLQIAKTLKSPIIQGVINSEIGQTYYNEKDYETALKYKLEAVKLLGNNSKGDAFLPFMTTAEVYLKLKQYKLAKQFALKANNIAENYEDKSLSFHNRKFVAKILSEVYFEIGNKAVGNEYLVKFYQFKDSMDKLSNAQELLYSELRYENEKNEMKLLSEQKIKDQQSEEEKSKQKIISIGIFIILIIVLVFSVFIFNRFKITQKQKSIIEQKEIETQKQKHLLEEKQKEIVDSITYAKRLQEAILPPTEFIKTHFPESFILYKPKDIVAGDFYWAEKIDNLFFIASADSTGHGVPGAMVSVVCSNALNRSVNEFGLTDTGKILDKTRELVIQTFEKSNEEVKDGMDISLLCIDKQHKKVFWSGANNPLWFIQNTVTLSEVEKSTGLGLNSARPDNKLFEIKADKQPVGKSYELKPFTSNEMEYKSNTTFYLFTDGLADQFGGPKGKKFKYKQFEEMLLSISHKTMAEQAIFIHQKFDEWKGNLEQVDDVCVIGIKI